MTSKVAQEVDSAIDSLIREYVKAEKAPTLKEIKKALPKDCSEVIDKLYKKVYKNEFSLLYTVAFVRCFDNTPKETLEVICDALPRPELSMEWFMSYTPKMLYCLLRKGQAEGNSYNVNSWVPSHLDFS